MIPTDGLAHFAKSSERIPRSANRLSQLLHVVFAAVGFAASGCSAFRGVSEYIQYNDDTNDYVIGLGNGIRSHLAWRARVHEFSDQPHLLTFGAGFRAGYKNVASGGNGCPPPVPPRKYWGWKYQTEKGQAKVSAWYSGFPYGAIAGEQKGVGNFRDIQVSYPIKTQYSPEFRAGGAPGAQPELLPQVEADEYETPRMPGQELHWRSAIPCPDSKIQSVGLSSPEFWTPLEPVALDGNKVKDQYPIWTQYSPVFRAGGTAGAQRELLRQMEADEFLLPQIRGSSDALEAKHSSPNSKSRFVGSPSLLLLPPPERVAPDKNKVKDQKR